MNAVDTVGVALSPDELDKLVQAVARAVADRIAERASFTVAEVAARSNYSKDHVYREIREGRLAAVRPGGGAEMRITPDAERLWIWGQRQLGDEPVVGVDPKVAARNSMKRRAK